jgi:DNA-binding MarR family transcriptional regulator
VDEAQALRDEIMGPLTRRFSGATVLFHHAVAERLGLGPSDHKCLDLLRERGPMTGSQLAAVTGLTTGAVTGVVARLERAGYLRRVPDPADRRRQWLVTVPERLADVQAVFDSLPPPGVPILEDFDAAELAVIARFLERAVDYAHDRTAAMRAGTLRAGGRTPVLARRTT